MRGKKTYRTNAYETVYITVVSDVTIDFDSPDWKEFSADYNDGSPDWEYDAIYDYINTYYQDPDKSFPSSTEREYTDFDLEYRERKETDEVQGTLRPEM